VFAFFSSQLAQTVLCFFKLVLLVSCSENDDPIDGGFDCGEYHRDFFQWQGYDECNPSLCFSQSYWGAWGEHVAQKIPLSLL